MKIDNRVGLPNGYKVTISMAELQAAEQALNEAKLATKNNCDKVTVPPKSE